LKATAREKKVEGTHSKTRNHVHCYYFSGVLHMCYCHLMYLSSLIYRVTM